MDYIKTMELSKCYGSHTVIEDLSVLFKRGTITAITGKSGCGKSTLLNMLGLLENPSSGSIEYESYNGKKQAKSKKAKLLRYEIAYLFQNFALIDNESVKRNLMIALAYSKQKKGNQDLIAALQKVHLDPSILNTKVYKLSGGEQQRVAMARILLKPCSVVLADEPTGNLDKKNTYEIFNLLKNMAKDGKIVVVATHDLELAKLCDERIVL